MVNIGGFKNLSNTVGAGKFSSINENRNVKNSSKEKNTDKVDFSSLQNNKQTAGTYGNMRVGQKHDKSDGLSKTAKEYLNKLRKKFGNMDFIIADFSTDEEADKLLGKGKGEYNVLITPDLLEKMAADEDVAAEYEGMIEESVGSIEDIKEGLGEDADMVEKFGVSIDADGRLQLRAKLMEGLVGDNDSGTVKANTVDELLERLNSVKEEQAEKLAKIREQKAEEAKKLSEKADKKAEKENKPFSVTT